MEYCNILYCYNGILQYIVLLQWNIVIYCIVIMGAPNPFLAVKLKGHFLAYGALKPTYAALLTTERLAGLALLHLHHDVPIDVDNCL